MNKKSPTGCRPDQLFGLWLIDPDKLQQFRDQALAIDLDQLAKMNAETEAANADKPAPKLYQNDNGVAVIEISGPTTKYPTSFQGVIGGTSTMMVERALMQAVDDPAVNSIMLHMDGAPGGTVAGAFDLADRIKQTRQSKSVYGHGSDMMASAAYLFGSQCDHLSCNKTALVGNVGTRSQLVDTSAKLEKDGIKVIPIVAGKHKSLGMSGVPVTDEHVQEAQREVNALNDLFVKEVSTGRIMSQEKVRRMEARCYVGEEAMKMGLVDQVCSFDQAMKQAIDAKPKQLRTGQSGTPGNRTTAAPFMKGTSKMDILQAIREVFGAADMTEEQAAAAVQKMHKDAAANANKLTATTAELTRLTGEVATLQTQVAASKPTKPTATELYFASRCVSQARDEAIKNGAITPAVADALEQRCIKKAVDRSTISLSRTVEDDDYKLVNGFATTLEFYEAIKGNKPVPPTGSQTGVQLLSRETPGGDESTKKQVEAGDAIGKQMAEAELKRRELARR